MAIIISGAFLFYWFILLQPLAAANLNEPWLPAHWQLHIRLANSPSGSHPLAAKQ
jgi:hypothetical protein